MVKRVWLIYDLGFDGDYTKLYEWLDNIGAKECVLGGATFMYDFRTETEDRDDVFQELEHDIPVDNEANPSARIYAITKVGDNIIGRFLFGNRKTAPWYGSSHHEADGEDG